MAKFTVEVQVLGVDADSAQEAIAFVDAVLQRHYDGHEMFGFMIEQDAATCSHPAPDNQSWGMFSDEADECVSLMVDNLLTELNNGQIQQSELSVRLEELFADIARAGFGEVYDTEPRGDIYDVVLNHAREELGWNINPWDY